MPHAGGQLIYANQAFQISPDERMGNLERVRLAWAGVPIEPVTSLTHMRVIPLACAILSALR